MFTETNLHHPVLRQKNNEVQSQPLLLHQAVLFALVGARVYPWRLSRSQKEKCQRDWIILSLWFSCTLVKDLPVCQDSVYRKLLSLKANTSPGTDSIYPVVLKEVTNEISEPLIKLF